MNVLMILTDQQRHDAVGYRDPSIKTPNLDNLAKQSVDCKATYAQSPQCQPSRASLFTGRYPTAHKVWWNSIQLPNSEKTIANYLREFGFHTCYIGKLHFSERRNETKLAIHFGFDTTFLTHDWHRLCIKNQQVDVVSEYYNILRTPKWYGRLQNKKWQHDEIVTDKALDFLRKRPYPYFLVVSYNAPHPPYAAPPPYTHTYDPDAYSGPENSQTYEGAQLSVDDWKCIKSQYYGSISWIDENIGRLLSAVDLDDTIVVYTSDHGDILGEHGFFSKGPFTYDGNTRVPLLIRIPGISPYLYDHLVQHIDVLPTILTKLGLTVPPDVQGRSLLAGLRENKIVNYFALSMIGHNPRLRMIRYKQFKYWIYGQEERCFDMEKDPQELHNITDNGVLNEMRFRLLQALIEAEDPCPQLITRPAAP